MLSSPAILMMRLQIGACYMFQLTKAQSCAFICSVKFIVENYNYLIKLYVKQNSDERSSVGAANCKELLLECLTCRSTLNELLTCHNLVLALLYKDRPQKLLIKVKE